MRFPQVLPRCRRRRRRWKREKLTFFLLAPVVPFPWFCARDASSTAWRQAQIARDLASCGNRCKNCVIEAVSPAHTCNMSPFDWMKVVRALSVMPACTVNANPRHELAETASIESSLLAHSNNQHIELNRNIFFFMIIIYIHIVHGITALTSEGPRR